MIAAQHHEWFRELCDAARAVVLVTHMNPDGDALGSECGLARYLRAHGKAVRIVNGDPTPPILAFLWNDTEGPELYDPAVHDAALRDTDLLILVDNAAPDRLGSMERIVVECAAHTLCIDHHPSRGAPWFRHIVDVESCATAAMIHDLVRARGWTPDAVAAEAIYVGLATDTGFFRFNSTSARAHRIAAELLEAGVHPARAYQRIYERNSVAFTRLLGHALSGLRIDADGAVASVKITRQLVEALQAGGEDTAEITTALLAMDGVRVAALFRELPDGRTKVSLRSKGELDVHALATEFGGGGHRNASGIVMSERLDRAVLRVTERAATLLRQLDGQRAAP